MRNTFLKLFSAVLFNAAVLITFLMFFNTTYEMPDDAGYAQYIADGFYNIKFMGYFMTLFIGVIQSVVYPINAFVVVHLAFAYFAFVAITYVFIDKFGYLVGLCISGFITGFFAVNHYQIISFSRIPALLTVSGFLLVLHSINSKKLNVGIFFGALLVLAGAMYRFEIFEVSVVMLSLFVFGRTIACFLFTKKHSFKILLKMVFEPRRLRAFLLIVIICFTLNYLSIFINSSTKELSHYNDYTSARSAVWDYPLPSYNDCQELYNEINIDADDLKILGNALDEKGAFTLEKLKEIKQIQNKYNIENRSIISTLSKMISSEVGNIRAIADKGIASLAFFLVLLSFVIMMKKQSYIIPILLVFGIFVFYLYLWWIERPVFRAVYVLWLSSTVYLLFSLDYSGIRTFFLRLCKVSIKQKLIIKALCTVLVVAVSIGGLYLSTVSNAFLTENPQTNSQTLKYSKLNKYLNNNIDKKYILSRDCDFSNNNYSIFYISKTDYEKNWVRFNSTYYLSPMNNKEIWSFGTDNLYEYLLDDNVFLITNSDSDLVRSIKHYLNKYYSDDDTIIIYNIIEENYYGYNVYKLIKRKD